MLGIARHMQRQRDIAVAINEATLDTNDPNWILDFQCNLTLLDDSALSQGGFRPRIGTQNGLSSHLINNDEIDAIVHVLNLLWKQCTESVHPMIQEAKKKRTKHFVTIFLFGLLSLVGFFAYYILDGFRYGQSIIWCYLFGLLGLEIWIAYCFHVSFYRKDISDIKQTWRESFLSGVVQYVDDWQTNWNTTNIKFVMLYPMKKPIGTVRVSPFIFIRLSNGVMNHNPPTLYHVPPEIEIGECEEGEEGLEGQISMRSAPYPRDPIVNELNDSNDSIVVSNLDKPLLLN